MRHQVKKIKFKKGQDSTETVRRKLALNFIDHGKIETTVKKAKVLKSLIDQLVYQAKEKNEANKNILLRRLGDPKTVDKLFNLIVPVFSDRNSGFVKLVKTGQRLGDGSEMARVEWVKPVIAVGSGKMEAGKKKLEVGKKAEKEDGRVDKINKTSQGKRS